MRQSPPPSRRPGALSGRREKGTARVGVARAVCLNGGLLVTHGTVLGTRVNGRQGIPMRRPRRSRKPSSFRDRFEVHPSSVAMESASRPLPKAAEQVPDEPSPVAPYLKKKPEPKCLQALDPILTSLLSSDALVAGGDGLFVSPKSLRARRHLCSPAGAKQAWRKRPCPRDEAAADPGAGGGRGGGGPAAKLRPSDPPSGKGARAPLDVSRGVTPAPDAPARPEDEEEGEGGEGEGGAAAPAGCCPGGGIFQGKSEEASLDLVFDFLTQLQYHTHPDGGVPICVDFLRGSVRRAGTGAWRSVCDDSQDQLERLYCNPDNESVRVKYQGCVFTLDLHTMQMHDFVYDQVRRLTTPPCPVTTPPDANPTSNYHTVWKYYCKDDLGWREYSEPVVRLIEEATGHGLKEVRFVTLQNQYVLNIQEGFQQNAVFGFRREIRKRPLFLSSVLLTPYLQTLGGLPSSKSPGGVPPPSPTTPTQPAPPAPPRLFPETWLPMASCQDFLQVSVSPEDRSYRTVYSLFHRTVSETRFRILKILRVQNPFLWEKYKRKKEYMSRKMSESERGLNERHLFHGTSQDAVEGICKHNFDPRVCGKHATMFGQGSYFARKAIYSHNFSKRSPKGVHCMFLAKVLTGRFTVGNPCMRRPPPVRSGDPSSDLFDSCVDNWVDPQIFVIFNDDQCYPYFIIQYEEVSSTVPI
ncbi:hypothetical protein AAFF_G00248370 [Aldrovandia affinis]|uniref:Poly [ADP-ribose] polymerase n=1 Tax=Aldrovandia affinis TaxID=143900 RepID=A0AAD7RDU2_9TELE|nr:hypothetical protein AAFF_G00248370 [Aldrovandia affinis]